MECGCPEIGGHTPHCLAGLGRTVLDGAKEIPGRSGACDHHWLEVRTKGWMRFTICKHRCGARRRFTPEDFNAGIAAGIVTMLPVRI